MPGRSQVIAPFAFHPAQEARRNAQLAAIGNYVPPAPSMAEPQPDPNRFSPDDYKALAPDMRATIRNPVAHSQFTELFLLLRPERAETLLAKGVTVDTFTKLKEVVAYYRSRAYGDAPRDHKLEAARRAVLGEIIQKVRSATK